MRVRFPPGAEDSCHDPAAIVVAASSVILIAVCMGTPIVVCKASDVKAGEGKVVLVGSDEIALFRVEEKFYACTNTCPHRGGPIGEGQLEGRIVTCPWHGWEFDVTTGKMPVNPNIGITTYPVAVVGDDLAVVV